MRELHSTYAGTNVELVSVHTPEFDHERDVAKVQAALDRFNLDFPVAIDNDWAIWRGYNNHYWPALYLVDKQGVIRDHHRGELHSGSRWWERWVSAIERLRNEPDPAADAG